MEAKEEEIKQARLLIQNLNEKIELMVDENNELQEQVEELERSSSSEAMASPDEILF